MNKGIINEKGLARILMALLVIAWGFDYVPAKWVLELLTPSFLMFFKFAVGALFVILLKLITRNKGLIRKKTFPFLSYVHWWGR